MSTTRELAVPLEEIRGIQYSCPICRRKIFMSLDAVKTFYMWREPKQFCPDCGRDTPDVVYCLERHKEPLSTLAGILAGRSGLERLDVALIVATP